MTRHLPLTVALARIRSDWRHDNASSNPHQLDIEVALVNLTRQQANAITAHVETLIRDWINDGGPADA